MNWIADSNSIHLISTYPIIDANKNYELQYIRTILHNNNDSKNNLNHTEQKIPPKKKWVTFTYTRKGTRIITRLFKNTNIQISFKITNTIKIT
jgi:hypothetical protein